MQRKRTFADLDREIVPVVAPQNSVYTSFAVSGPAEVTSDGLLIEVTRTEFQARCSKSNDKLVAYLRREVIRVTLALDDRTHRQKVLQGPPGCGKKRSCMVLCTETSGPGCICVLGGRPQVGSYAHEEWDQMHSETHR
jgi:hypothetical protein